MCDISTSKVKAEIKIKYTEAEFIFEVNAGSSEIYLIATDPYADYFNEFLLIWINHLGVVQTESFDFISQATARMALVLYVQEKDEYEGEIIAVKENVANGEWVSQWITIADNNTEGVKQ